MAEFLSERVFRKLEKEIKSLEIGDKLPSEREFVSKYGVSRNIIREVLKKFEEMGMIEIIPGSGARKVDKRNKKFAENLEKMLLNNGTTLKDLVEVRESLETQIFLLDMHRADENDFKKLWEIYDAMDRSMDNPMKYHEHDIEFHIALAEATKNRMYSFLIYNLYEITEKQLFLITEYSPEAIFSAQIEHKGLLEAIKNQDEDRVKNISHIHFTDILSIVAK